MSDRPDVSALIVNYNGGALLGRVVDSLLASGAGLSLQVLLWDNASRDGSVDPVAAAHPEIAVRRSPRNIGFVQATNRQLEEVRGRTVLLLNSDAVPEGDAIRRLHEVLRQRPELGAVGPRLLLADGALDAACRRRAKTLETYIYRATGLDHLLATHPRFGRYNATDLPPTQPCEVDALSGACMLVRWEALQSIGVRLDERFRMYCEDEDWCVRLVAAGWRIAYEPSAVVWHLKGGSSAATLGTRLRTAYEWHRSVALFHRKHLHDRYVLPVNVAVYAAIVGSGLLTLLRRTLPRRLRAMSAASLRT